MPGVEFAMDEVAELTVGQMLKHGMCAAFTLNNPRVIRLEPPLIISDDEVRKAVEILDEAITETSELLAMLASGSRPSIRSISEATPVDWGTTAPVRA